MASLYPDLSDVAGMAFVPYYNQIIKLLQTDSALRETITGIMKQVGYAAAGAAVGGAVGGPLGALGGTLVGGIYGYSQASSYSSLIQVLREIDDERKRQLVIQVQELVGSGSIEALTQFVGTQVKRELFVNLIQQFVSSK